MNRRLWLIEVEAFRSEGYHNPKARSAQHGCITVICIQKGDTNTLAFLGCFIAPSFGNTWGHFSLAPCFQISAAFRFTGVLDRRKLTTTRPISVDMLSTSNYFKPLTRSRATCAVEPCVNRKLACACLVRCELKSQLRAVFWSKIGSFVAIAAATALKRLGMCKNTARNDQGTL